MSRAKAATRRPDKRKAVTHYDVVALVASAGGHAAIETVIRGLPEGFPTPIVVMQHLPPSVTEPLRAVQKLPFAVAWARPEAALAPGHILVAPPRSFLEVMPDGTCVIAPCERGALGNPIDVLLGSLARSFGHRAIAVVLSGMLQDGAQGARELRLAGGQVIAQSGAEYASMPEAALRSGGADVSLPLERIAGLLAELAAGGSVPRPLSELDAVQQLFGGDGRAQQALREIDWRTTPLGSVLDWSPTLVTAVRNLLGSNLPACIFWGPHFIQIYNEAFVPLLGAKPAAAGRPARITWPELWGAVGPRLESVLRTGEAVRAEDQLFQSERHGYPEELFVTYSLGALHDVDGTPRGVLGTVTESTERVRASRRLNVLRDLASITGAESAHVVAQRAAKVLAEAPLDVPFALFYLYDKGRMRAGLAAAAGVNPGSREAPHTLVMGDPLAVWPLGDVKRTGSSCTVDDLPARLPGVHTGPWPEPSSSAVLVPLRTGPSHTVDGVLVLGMSPRLKSDEMYADFLHVVAQQVTSSIVDAEVRRRERERGDRLAELDHDKVQFFSNISHEFRTPLTLLLAPLEELLARQAALPAELREPIESAARNGRRLLTLVNTLLDFSVAESHREHARPELTDLAALTTDIASAFRSAVEAAGLQLEVHCESVVPQVWIDRQMWEKVVSNLLSNAFKFTFEGKISVTLRALSLHAELVVRDTGIGIPEDEVKNLFKRFHRVRGMRARTAEGSGIGLWMVDDLVKRMSGQVRVHSRPDVGSAFTVWIPYKPSRAVPETPAASDGAPPTDFALQAAREAARWSSKPEHASAVPAGVLESVFGPPEANPRARPARILVVDDNADMREYIQRLLAPQWRVETAADGARGLEAAIATRPDAILTDVMMPGLDGFELLERIRAHPELRHTPVILVTARAGEQSAIDGLMAGADDYIAKPFSPRELVARVGAALGRADVEARLREAEARRLAEEALRRSAQPRR